GRGVAVGGHDPRRHARDAVEAVFVRVHENDFLDRKGAGEAGDAIHEFGCVGGAAADDNELHSCPSCSVAPTVTFGVSGSAVATWQAAEWLTPSSRVCGSTVSHMSIASGHRARNRQPGWGLITFGGSPR